MSDATVAAVKQYLKSEREDFLAYGRRRADALLGANSDPFAKQMYRYWKRYYKGLIKLSETLEGNDYDHPNDQGQLRGALKKEADVIKKSIDALRKFRTETPGLSLTERRQLRAVIWMLRVERRSNRQLIEELKK